MRRFLKNVNSKIAFLLPNMIIVGVESAFGKISGSIGRKRISRRSTKGQGVSRIFSRGGDFRKKKLRKFCPPFFNSTKLMF